MLCFAAGSSSRALSARSDSSGDSKGQSSDVPSRRRTPVGKLDDVSETADSQTSTVKDNAYARFPNDTNPVTGEVGGPRGPEPTRYGEWERKGRAIDF